MTVDEIHKATAEAKARAEELAQPYIVRGNLKGATEGERMLGEAAALALQNAETRAGLVDANTARLALDEIKNWAGEQEAALGKLYIEELAAGRSDFTTGPVKEAQDRMLAGLDMSQEQMKKRVTKEALDVWLRACDNLSTYDPPISHLANGSDTHH